MAAGSTEWVLACGEVGTCLLPHSRSLPGRDTARLLELRAGERIRLSERPNQYAVSPDVLTGVDCRLPTASRAKVRVVGTVTGRATVTGGRMLQASAYFQAAVSGPDKRLPWGHYLSRPGVVEPFGRLPAGDAAGGFVASTREQGELDLATITERLLGKALRHPLLDQRAPFKARRTRLRWTALRPQDGAGPAIERFTLAVDGLRTVELRLPQEVGAASAARLCEDLALHDWLLTALVGMVERSRLGSVDGRRAVAALRPAVDHLLHLWLPAARVEPILVPLWEVLERHPGFTRQWQILVQRIRDQLALQAVTLHVDV